MGGRGGSSGIGGAKVGEVRERKGLVFRVMDKDKNKSLVEVLSGEYGTRKPGSKFLMDTKTLDSSTSKIASSVADYEKKKKKRR